MRVLRWICVVFLVCVCGMCELVAGRVFVSRDLGGFGVKIFDSCVQCSYIEEKRYTMSLFGVEFGWRGTSTMWGENNDEADEGALSITLERTAESLRHALSITCSRVNLSPLLSLLSSLFCMSRVVDAFTLICLSTYSSLTRLHTLGIISTIHMPVTPARCRSILWHRHASERTSCTSQNCEGGA